MMEKSIIIKCKNGKYVREEIQDRCLVDATKPYATPFTEDEADQIIAYLGEGEKEPATDENHNNK